MKKQLNLGTLAVYDHRRKAYARRLIETAKRDEKAKDEILKRIQEETLTAVGTLSEEETNRKNKEGFLIDHFIRDLFGEQKLYLKQVLGPRGTWRVRYPVSFKKASLQDTGEGTHCLLTDRLSNGFKYIDTSGDLCHSLLRELHNEELSDIDIYLQTIYNIDGYLGAQERRAASPPAEQLDDSAFN